MKTFKRGLVAAFAGLCLVAAGCGGESGEQLSKEEAAKLAKADNMRDFCAEFNWYGDGECDDFCLDPDPDCDGCVAEGQSYEDMRAQNQCCDGTKPVSDAMWNEQIRQCIHPRCPCFVCTACGNGICGVGENRCNCPEDCSDDCLGEGEHFEDIGRGKKCCQGLKQVPDFTFSSELVECFGSRCPCYVCTVCGNGVCGPGENACNCPIDCAEPCGGLTGLGCLDHKVCIDDPTDSCYPDSGGRSCMGICVPTSGS